MKKNKIFIACDNSNINQIKKIIKHTKPYNLIPKFGLQFFYSKNGRKFLENYKSEFMLDIKASDIPQTISSALHSIKDLKKIKYITVMASVGLKGLKVFQKQALKINKSIIVCGVTILTSLDNKSLREIGYKDSVEKLVLKQAALIKKAGLKGIVASGSEAKIIRKKYKNLFILTPGIRLPGDKVNDQSRVLTPKAALHAGASAIVLGRSIHSGKIKQNIKRLIDHLN
ncbi:orotidine-5'-phosphate decarboxylase [Candidatus Pelagibacter sp.]|nr:orotidine-5'-phosphate decarboxylase [Candidatus Pelagibacter sp.]